MRGRLPPIDPGRTVIKIEIHFNLMLDASAPYSSCQVGRAIRIKSCLAGLHRLLARVLLGSFRGTRMSQQSARLSMRMSHWYSA